jgi:hypothetical protein
VIDTYWPMRWSTRGVLCCRHCHSNELLSQNLIMQRDGRWLCWRCSKMTRPVVCRTRVRRRVGGKR